MELFRIDETDVILQDFEFGRGKIIISNSQHNVSYFWGAMGSTLTDFLTTINLDYFIGCLSDAMMSDPVCMKNTIRNVRQAIRDEIPLPWYKHLEFQKDMREILNRYVDNDYYTDEMAFINSFGKFHKKLNYHLIKDKYDRKDIEDMMEGLCDEPWHYIETTDNNQKIWLKRFYPKLINYLKKEKIKEYTPA